MMKLIAAVLLLALPSQAAMQHVPKWKRCGEMACYDMEGAKKLLMIDEELVYLYTQVKVLEANLDLEDKAHDQTRGMLITEEEKTFVLREANERLTLELKETVKQRNEAVAQKSKVSFGWVVAGALAVGLLGGWAGYELSKR